LIEKQSENNANAESEKLAAHFEELKIKLESQSTDENRAEQPEVQEEPVENPATGTKTS